MWWILALVLFGYIALLAGGLAALFGGIDSGAISSDSVNTGGGGSLAGLGSLPPLIYSFAASVGYVFPVLLGALASTGEFRHQTLTPTFLATPRRARVLGAKTIALFVVGAAFGVVALAASVGVGALVFNGFGIDPLLADSATWALIGRTVVAMALWAVIGVGLGVLVPSQVASIVIVLAFTQFVEPLLRFASSFTQVTADVGKFLPGAASDALVGASFFTLASPGGAVLASWQGGLVLLAYGLLATGFGYLVSWKRDVT
ncbi:ABC transporter permease [Cryobacterium sp. PAMC25264]|nr:ABC transporter permease [Cryobacterium sp. PAMC25264]